MILSISSIADEYLLFISSFLNQRFYLTKFIYVSFVTFIIFLGYTKFDFLNTKIFSQYKSAMRMTSMDISPTRMGSLIMDSQYIFASPLIGNGLKKETRFRFHRWIKDENFGHGNGMSNFIAYWGIPLFLYWIYCVYNFTRCFKIKKVESYSLLFLIMLLLQLEQFLLFPIFLNFFILDKNLLAEQ